MHVPLSIVPVGYLIAIIQIPDNASLQEIDCSKLPQNWKAYPAPAMLAEVGTKWANERKTLLLRVPSAVVEQEYNILINPLHPEMHQVKIIEAKDYGFDGRLFG